MDDLILGHDYPDKANREPSIERITNFAQRFGETHLTLACHAAFPLALTPNLLYQIWANFVPEAPWTAVADLLLSRLCREVGYELYEMDISVRNLLLKELEDDNRFGQQRLNGLAGFLTDYVTQRFSSGDPDIHNLAQAQQWTVLAYTQPDEAARELAEALSKAVLSADWAELIRVASLIETCAEPLKTFTPLIIYSRGIMYFAHGDLKGAEKHLRKLSHEYKQTEVYDVSLPIPSQVRLQICLDRAHEYMEAKEFQKAINFLHEIESETQEEPKKAVNSLLANIHYQWAMHYIDLANQEAKEIIKKSTFWNIAKTAQLPGAIHQLEEALGHMVQALKYEPGHPLWTESLQIYTKFKAGVDYFERDAYDDALDALKGLPTDFPNYDTVIQIRAGSFFRRAIQHANNERFDEAVKDMQQAEALVLDNETVREQLAELERLKRVFLHMKAMREAESLLEKERYQDALNAMQNIPSNFTGYHHVQSLRAVCEFHLGVQQAKAGNYTKGIEHLERATKLNPNEPVIKEQLEVLRRLQRDAPSIEAVNKGQSLMKNKRFADALEAMRDIPSSFGEYQEVQRLRAICEFNIGVQYANDRNLPQAIQHLTQATKYDRKEPIIKKQLEDLLTIQKLGGFEAIERRNRAFRKAQEVVGELNAPSKRNPLTPQRGYQLLEKLEEALRESDGDPQIVALRDQLREALSKR